MPTYERIFKSWAIPKNEKEDAYGKAFLKKYFKEAWFTHNRNLRKLRSWFNSTRHPEGKKFLECSYRNQATLRDEVKAYMATKIGQLETYALQYKHSVISMTWGIDELYAAFLEMKHGKSKTSKKKIVNSQELVNFGNSDHERPSHSTIHVAATCTSDSENEIQAPTSEVYVCSGNTLSGGLERQEDARFKRKEKQKRTTEGTINLSHFRGSFCY